MLNFVVRNSTNENVYWYKLRPNICIIADIKSRGWSVLACHGDDLRDHEPINAESTWFFKIKLTGNNCFSLYADQHFCNLHPHARIICCTNETSRKVTGCSNPNAHAQFPQAIPYLIISDHYWFSLSRTFLLKVCYYRATLNYTSKS